MLYAALILGGLAVADHVSRKAAASSSSAAAAGGGTAAAGTRKPLILWGSHELTPDPTDSHRGTITISGARGF